uniref:Uncharacterized protein n=1 Tax=viral metagenome TaxID=1070528 RepID=A0A6C0BWV9_9ZZZZ
MSCILYYSNFCEKCKSMLQNISKSAASEKMHFICIDNRISKNGACYIVLEKGDEVLLPPTVTKVPALLLLNKGHHVLFGDEITHHIMPKKNVMQEAAQNNSEPNAFSLGGLGHGVASDNFSFLDQDITDMSAKGEGGMRQLHHYTSVHSEENSIETPPDNYEANTIKGVSLDKLQQERNSDIS